MKAIVVRKDVRAIECCVLSIKCFMPSRYVWMADGHRLFIVHPQPEQGEVALKRVVGEYLEHGVGKPAGGGH